MPDRQLAQVEVVDRGSVARLELVAEQARDYAAEAKAPQHPPRLRRGLANIYGVVLQRRS